MIYSPPNKNILSYPYGFDHTAVDGACLSRLWIKMLKIKENIPKIKYILMFYSCDPIRINNTLNHIKRDYKIKSYVIYYLRSPSPCDIFLWDMGTNRWIENCGILSKQVVEIADTLRPSDVIWYHRTKSTLVQIMAWCLFDTKPLPEPMLNHYQMYP